TGTQPPCAFTNARLWTRWQFAHPRQKQSIVVARTISGKHLRVSIMCGIVGYTGRRQAEPILLAGLRRLEYRGYDSAGLATVNAGGLHLRKSVGRIAKLAGLLSEQPAPGTHGISHTRWATHGAANNCNAHPHLGGGD